MRRRAFIAGLGGIAALPLAARAQQPMPVVGILHSGGSAANAANMTAIQEGLKESGFVEGRNVTFEFRWADNHLDRLPALAAELVRLPVAVIVANSPAARPAMAVTSAIPIVFALSNDPVAEGLVASYNHPGGNVTGVGFLSAGLGGKRLELLRGVIPKGTVIGVLMNPEMLATVGDRKEVEAAAQAVGQPVVAVDVTGEHDLEPAFATMIGRGAGALLVGGGPFMFSNRERIVALATRHKLPASFALREYAVTGGLMSYGNNITEAYHQAGIYAGRIRKGEKPADMPVNQSSKFEFVLNLKTAKALGIEIHPQLLATADEVIE